MSRKVKNIIMITIIIIVCIASGFTIKFAKESGEGTNQGNPPQMLNSSGENNGNGQMGTPPSKPDESNGNSSTEPPAKPADSNGSNSTESQQNQMMGKPDGQNNSNSQENENMTSMPDMQNGENNTEIETSYYIIFGIEAFVVSILVIYLIMSGFNSKTLAETLNGAKNIIIYIILVAIVTTGLTFAQSYITKNISSSNTQNQIQNNMQMPGGQGETASNITYTASKEISEDSTIESGEYSSTTSNENAIIATGDVDVNLSNITVDKTGDSDGGDSSNFYGNNSAILAKNGANLTIKNATITTEADGANGNATFTAKNSKITTNNGDTFYITNTTATINLTNNTIVNNDSTGNFLRAQKDSWGNTGSNGENVTLTMTQQNAEGNIVIDSISTLDMTMSENSYYEGTINESNEAKSITLKLDSTSKIKLTGDSYITSLEDDDTTYSNIDFNGYKLYVNGVAIN